MKKSVEERFWSHVIKLEGENACWVWSRPGRRGYSFFGLNGKTQYAHVVSWYLNTGEFPVSFVCHRCDNPSCVRPDHLFLGTHKDNMLDMKQKGRAASGENHTSKLYPERVARGIRNGGAKLSEDEVREIRAIGKSMSYHEVARLYGIAESTVIRIRNRGIWKHLI